MMFVIHETAQVYVTLFVCLLQKVMHIKESQTNKSLPKFTFPHIVHVLTIFFPICNAYYCLFDSE